MSNKHKELYDRMDDIYKKVEGIPDTKSPDPDMTVHTDLDAINDTDVESSDDDLDDPNDDLDPDYDPWYNVKSAKSYKPYPEQKPNPEPETEPKPHLQPQLKLTEGDATILESKLDTDIKNRGIVKCGDAPVCIGCVIFKTCKRRKEMLPILKCDHKPCRLGKRG